MRPFNLESAGERAQRTKSDVDAERKRHRSFRRYKMGSRDPTEPARRFRCLRSSFPNVPGIRFPREE